MFFLKKIPIQQLLLIILVCTVSITIFPAVISVQAAPPPAVFDNGDFEYWSGSVLANWSDYLDGSHSYEQSTFVRNGTYSVRFNYNCTDDNQCSLQQGPSSTTDMTYTFQCWIYDDDPNVHAYVSISDDSVVERSNNSTDSGWQLLHVELLIDISGDSPFISIVVVNDTSTGTGVIYADASEYYQGTFAELPNLAIPFFFGVSLLLELGIIIKKRIC